MEYNPDSGLSFNLKTVFKMSATNNNETQPLLVVENFIDGQFLSTENYLDSFEPATGKVWAKIPDSGIEEVEQAVKAAKKAFRYLLAPFDNGLQLPIEYLIKLKRFFVSGPGKL